MVVKLKSVNECKAATSDVKKQLRIKIKYFGRYAVQ